MGGRPKDMPKYSPEREMKKRKSVEGERKK
jgi:hypothetical protein